MATPLPPLPEGPLLNPGLRVQAVPLGEGRRCVVIDDALRAPQAWREYATAARADFVERPGNAFPGPELALPDTVAAALDVLVARELRAGFGIRRTLHAQARLSLVARAPQALAPRQWFCHIDSLQVEPGQALLASVLYLFDDPALGGTAFYRPLRPPAEIAALIQDSAHLPALEFGARHGIAAGYMTASNRWFAKLASIPARYNRLIVYPGTVFHCGEITAPERLSDDPACGRLTLNGFFTCRRALARSAATGPG